MARTKETKMSPEQQEKMTQEVVASLQSSTYGKDYAQEHSSFFEEVENSDLEVVTENVAATTSCMEDERTKLNRHRIRRSASAASSARRHWRSISRHSSKFQGLTTASQSSSVPMCETVLIVSSASSEGDA